jgi:hypothetical protein
MKYFRNMKYMRVCNGILVTSNSYLDIKLEDGISPTSKYFLVYECGGWSLKNLKLYQI